VSTESPFGVQHQPVQPGVDLPVQRDSVQLLDGGAQAFPRMLVAIAEAKRRIHLEIYTFAWDDVGRRFVHALSEASRRGVHVHVILDGWGSLISGNQVATALRAAGCRVRIYHPFSALLLGGLRRNHRKILLVDDRIAVVGGINIGNEYEAHAQVQGWADLAVEVTGEAAKALGDRLRGHRTVQGVTSNVRIFLSGLGGGRKLRQRYLKAFRSAKRTLVVAHAYFLPDAGLSRSLRAAARRGVDVKLLLAGRSDVPFARAATVRLYRRFLKAGVRIFEWHQSVLHAKATLVDQERFLVGSFNLDPLSLANLEALVEVTSPDTIAAADQWLATKLSTSREILLRDLSHGWLQTWVVEVMGLVVARAVETFAKLLAVRRAAPFGEAGEGAKMPRLGVRRPRRESEPPPAR
jgi:cardiolipin synthase